MSYIAKVGTEVEHLFHEVTGIIVDIYDDIFEIELTDKEGNTTTDKVKQGDFDVAYRVKETPNENPTDSSADAPATDTPADAGAADASTEGNDTGASDTGAGADANPTEGASEAPKQVDAVESAPVESQLSDVVESGESGASPATPSDLEAQGSEEAADEAPKSPVNAGGETEQSAAGVVAVETVKAE